MTGSCGCFSLCRSLYFQPLLQHLTGHLLVLVKRVGVDVQRSGRLAVAQEARHGGHVSSAGDQEAGVGVPQGVDIQRSRQAMLLQDQLEPPGEGGGRHGEPVSMTAEDVVSVLQFPPIIRLRLPGALPLELPQQGLHLQREVDIPIPGGGFRLLDDDVLAGDLYRIFSTRTNTVRKHHQRGKISDELRQAALKLAEEHRDRALLDNDYASYTYAQDMEQEHLYDEARKRLE